MTEDEIRRVREIVRDMDQSHLGSSCAFLIYLLIKTEGQLMKAERFASTAWRVIGQCLTQDCPCKWPDAQWEREARERILGK